MTINRDALREAVLTTGEAAFAVLDGARFERLPATLRETDLDEARCLYLDQTEKHSERSITAPWLVGPLTDRSFEVVADLLDTVGGSACVFWVCPAGADALFRHLRGINMVRIAGAADRPAGEEETVLFRHCDANVLAQVVRELDASQQLRFMGPAALVAFLPDERWGRPSRIRRGDGDPPSGLLTLTPDTIARIDAARHAVLSRHVVAYLRRTLPAPLRDRPEAELTRAADASIVRASAYGVAGDGSHCRWAYLHVVTGGAIATDERIDRYMTSGSARATPDERVRQIMQATIHRLRKGA